MSRHAGPVIRDGDAVRVEGHGRTPYVAVSGTYELHGEKVVWVRKIGEVGKARPVALAKVRKVGGV